MQRHVLIADPTGEIEGLPPGSPRRRPAAPPREIAGVTPNPDATFMGQIARNLSGSADGFLRDRGYLILDRDNKFTAQFRTMLDGAGIEVVTRRSRRRT